MAILVVAEHDNSSLKPGTLNAVSAAQQIGGDVNVLVAGSDSRAVVEAATQLTGVVKVIHADNACYEHQLAESVAPLVAEFGKNHTCLLYTSPSPRDATLTRMPSSA